MEDLLEEWCVSGGHPYDLDVTSLSVALEQARLKYHAQVRSTNKLPKKYSTTVLGMRQLEVSLTELTTKHNNVIFLSHKDLNRFSKGSAVDVTGTSIRGTIHQTTSQSTFIYDMILTFSSFLLEASYIFSYPPSNHQSVNFHHIFDHNV